MEALIIEFCGVAGAGKSTLCEAIIHDEIFSKNIVDIFEARRRFNSRRLMNTVRYFSVIDFIRVIGFRNALGQSQKIGSLLMLVKLRMLYRFYNNTQCGILVVDHGITQQILSLLGYDDKTTISEELIKSISVLLADDSAPFKIVLCDLASEIALERMHLRGRKTGSIDTTQSEKKQLQMMAVMQQNYSTLSELIKQYKGNDSFEIDMTYPTDNIAIISENLVEGFLSEREGHSC